MSPLAPSLICSGLTGALLLAAGSTSLSATKPCHGRYSNPELEEMLPRARVALRLPGTDEVALDPARGCIAIQVRSGGTARLVTLILRGVELPRGSVALSVEEPDRPALTPMPR